MSSAPLASVRLTHHYDSPPEQVFDAWLDGRTLGKWLFATPKGKMVRVEVDPGVGGTFTLTERRDGDDVEHVGQYLEIDRPHRLVFEFGVKQFSEQKTRVKVDIVPVGTGADLTLTHEKVLPEWVSKTEEGWSTILVGLAQVLHQPA